MSPHKSYRFKAKNSEVKPYPLCLGNVSKDFTLHNMKKKFPVDYNAIDTNDTYRHLMKETQYKIMFGTI